MYRMTHQFVAGSGVDSASQPGPLHLQIEVMGTAENGCDSYHVSSSLGRANDFQSLGNRFKSCLTPVKLDKSFGFDSRPDPDKGHPVPQGTNRRKRSRFMRMGLQLRVDGQYGKAAATPLCAVATLIGAHCVGIVGRDFQFPATVNERLSAAPVTDVIVTGAPSGNGNEAANNFRAALTARNTGPRHCRGALPLFFTSDNNKIDD